MHGSLDKCFCMNCSAEYKFNFDLSTEFVCKKCNVKGKVRVDIVWFGEQPKYLDKIYKYLDRTDVFLSIGTSNNVYPLNIFVHMVGLIGWLIVALMWNDRALIIINAVGVAIMANGLVGYVLEIELW